MYGGDIMNSTTFTSITFIIFAILFNVIDIVRLSKGETKDFWQGRYSGFGLTLLGLPHFLYSYDSKWVVILVYVLYVAAYIYIYRKLKVRYEERWEKIMNRYRDSDTDGNEQDDVNDNLKM